MKMELKLGVVLKKRKSKIKFLSLKYIYITIY